VNSNTEWMNMSPDAFLERYAPAAASRRGNREPPPRRTPDPTPAPQAIQAVAHIQATTTYNPIDKTLTTKGTRDHRARNQLIRL
jgi:hypothetical protein